LPLSALLLLADALPPHSGRASHLSVSVALVQHEGWGEAGALPCVSPAAWGGVDDAEADAELRGVDVVIAAAVCGEGWRQRGKVKLEIETRPRRKGKAGAFRIMAIRSSLLWQQPAGCSRACWALERALC